MKGRVGKPWPPRILRSFGLASGLVVLSEGIHWLASRRLLSRCGCSGLSTAVIVLGYGAPRTRLRGAIQRWRLEMATVQRWRAEIAVRTLATAGSGCVIFSGSGTTEGNGPSEAEAMAAYATSQLGLDPRCVHLESSATHTWQNISYSLRFAESCDRIAFASDPLHALRARRYVARQRPDLVARLSAAHTCRLFERWWLKVPIIVYEGWRWVRDKAFEREEKRSS